MNEPEKRLHGLDQLRALAILLVLLFHYRIWYGIPEVLKPSGLNELAGFGWTGVDLFFVLSGYLIGDKLLQDQDRFGRIRFAHFYLNRALRILPAFFLALALYFGVEELREGRGLQPLWKFLTFTQNIPIDLRLNTFSHAWSLCVEEHFYLVLPLLLFLLFARGLQRRALWLILGVFALGLALRTGLWLEFVEPLEGRARRSAAFLTIYYPTYTRLDGLTVGVAIAALIRYRPEVFERIARHGNWLPVPGLACLAFVYVVFDGFILSPQFTDLAPMLLGFPLVSLGYGFIVLSALSPGSLLHGLRFAPTAKLAAYSYAIYLVHKMSNHWINGQLPSFVELGEVETFALCLAAGVLAGALVHYGVERPFLKLRDRVTPRFAGASAAVRE